VPQLIAGRLHCPSRKMEVIVQAIKMYLISRVTIGCVFLFQTRLI